MAIIKNPAIIISGGNAQEQKTFNLSQANFTQDTTINPDSGYSSVKSVLIPKTNALDAALMYGKTRYGIKGSALTKGIGLDNLSFFTELYINVQFDPTTFFSLLTYDSEGKSILGQLLVGLLAGYEIQEGYYTYNITAYNDNTIKLINSDDTTPASTNKVLYENGDWNYSLLQPSIFNISFNIFTSLILIEETIIEESGTLPANQTTITVAKNIYAINEMFGQFQSYTYANNVITVSEASDVDRSYQVSYYASDDWATNTYIDFMFSRNQIAFGDTFNLLAENIKQNISILGVTGTYSGGGGSAPVMDGMTLEFTSNANMEETTLDIQ